MKHSDGKYFAAVDVFKGMCRKRGEQVVTDSFVCPMFREAPKCRNCDCFDGPDSGEIGKCRGLGKEYWAYGDMNAKTCEGYVQKESTNRV